MMQIGGVLGACEKVPVYLGAFRRRAYRTLRGIPCSCEGFEDWNQHSYVGFQVSDCMDEMFLKCKYLENSFSD